MKTMHLPSMNGEIDNWQQLERTLNLELMLRNPI